MIVEMIPPDAHNARLAEAVRPPGWTNPKPAGRYNLVIIEAGARPVWWRRPERLAWEPKSGPD